MCEREGLHQIDLLAPAPEKVTEAEFRAKIRGQKKLAQINQEIVRKGLKPVSTTFQTQKDFLRKAIDECSGSARNFKEFQSLLLEKNNISVICIEEDIDILHPDRNRGITEKALGTDYGMEHMEKRFLQMKKGSSQNTEQLHIILSRAITTKIQLLSSTIGHIYVLWLICRQMLKPCRVKLMPVKLRSPICSKWRIP